MERRTILKLMAAGVLPASGGLVQIACDRGGYRSEFFSRAELDLLDALTEVILPADQHSPGARAALVARYIDVMAADADARVQERFRTGLEAVAAMAQDRFDREFSECDATQRDAIVGEMARNEQNPSGAAERFFTLVKRATIEGYYTSQVGIEEDLGYTGNTAVDEFPGCTHGGHTTGLAA